VKEEISRLKYSKEDIIQRKADLDRTK